MALTFSQTLIPLLVLGLSWTCLTESRRQLQQIASFPTQDSNQEMMSSSGRVVKDVDSEKENRRKTLEENLTESRRRLQLVTSFPTQDSNQEMISSPGPIFKDFNSEKESRRKTLEENLTESQRQLQLVTSFPTQDSNTKMMTSPGRVSKDVNTEKENRRKILEENLRFIQLFNSNPNKTFSLSANGFVDLTNTEFEQSHTGGFKSLNLKRTTSAYDKILTQSLASDSPVPSRIDWRERNAVTPIKDQGSHCGSCWAFASVAAIESLTYIKTGTLQSLSEQQLLDCVRTPYTQGCKGGNHNEAFKYIIENRGITTGSSYPYTAQADTCKTNFASHPPYATIQGYIEVPKNNEVALKFAVAKQPVVAFIDSRGKEFQFYSGGVFTGPCGATPEHIVTIVGYGTSEEGIDYWLIKNSWGTNWGENGYMRLQRNAGFEEGRCGIAMEASYPTML